MPLIVPGLGQDPTRLELLFHSDGRFIVRRFDERGFPSSSEFVTTANDVGPLLVTLRAAPGGNPLDPNHPTSPFFEMEIRRRA